MNNMHDTDQLFRDAAKRYREEPGEGAWAQIDAAIQGKKKKKYVLFWTGIAAVSILLLGFGAGFLVRSVTLKKTEIANAIPPQQKAFASTNFTIPELIEEIIPSLNNNVIQDKSIAKNLQSTPHDHIRKEKVSNDFTKLNPNRNQSTVDEDMPLIIKPEHDVVTLEEEKNEEIIATEITPVENPEALSAIEKDAMLKKMLTHAPENSDSDEQNSSGYSSSLDFPPPKTKHNNNRWSLGGDVAAAYAYRKTDNVDESFSDRSPSAEESGVMSWNAGVYAMGYISDNVSVKTGLSYASYGQGTQNIYAWESKDFFHINSSLGSIQTSLSRVESSSTSISNSGIYDEAQSILLGNSMLMSDYELSNPEMQVIQQFNYIELPLLIQLSTSRNSSRISLHAEGGVYTGVLAENQAFLKSGNDSYFIGSTEGLRRFSFGGVAAAGAGISLSKSLSASITPELRYSFLSISKLSSITYHPYQFSIGLGLFYHF